MTKSSTYKKKGGELFWEDKHLEAIKNFDNAIKVNPKDFDSWDFRGRCKYELEQYEQAVKDFDEAIELNPENYTSWDFRGRCKYFLKQYEQAVKDFDEAIELNPENYTSWDFRGRCKYFLKQYEQAVKDFDEAIELNPKDYMTWFFRGGCKYLLEQYVDAINNLDKTIELNPEYSNGWGIRGFAYLQTLNDELAEIDFKKAYEIDGDSDGNYNYNIGKICYRKKDYYSSIRHYVAALKIDPENYRIYADMSFAKLELGDFKNSLDDLKNSKKLFKNNAKEFFSIFDNEEIQKVLRICKLNNDLKAIEIILKFLYKNNKDNKSLLMGISEFNGGNFYNAIYNLLEVYEIDNQNKECILYLGKAKLALKDYKNALVDFKHYIALEKNEEVEKLIKSCEDKLK